LLTAESFEPPQQVLLNPKIDSTGYAHCQIRYNIRTK
jgi:hypothetical protein